jgi:ribonuclease R
VEEIVPYERNAATMMIENFMVAANETVAEHFYWLGIPFVYRTHGVPDEEKLQRLKTFVQGYGYRFRWSHGQVHPRELQSLLAELKEKPEEATISVMTLRSMQRALYTTTCGGHFGLALRYYCHFTSPIRRYPDLQIHRIIKEYLHGKLGEKRRSHYDSILPAVCLQSSNMERRADEAERETNKQKMCEYMKGHLGETFDGAISGVTGWGVYVQLPNTVEGLIPVRSLRDDYYAYVEERAQLVGERTGRTYGLGQNVKVSVASVDTMARTIDFELCANETDGETRADVSSGEETTSREDAKSQKKKHFKKPGKLNRSGQEMDTENHKHRGHHHGRKHHAGKH